MFDFSSGTWIGLVIAVLQAFTAIMIWKNNSLALATKNAAERTEHNTNSLAAQLNAEIAKTSHAEGRAEQKKESEVETAAREEGRAEQKKESEITAAAVAEAVETNTIVVEEADHVTVEEAKVSPVRSDPKTVASSRTPKKK